MKVNVSVLLMLVAMPLFSTAGSPFFFRVTSTQTTQITSFNSAETITWSNVNIPSTCQVEWSPSLSGIWLTNHFPEVACTSIVTICTMPIAFSTGTQSPILSQSINQPVLVYGPDVSVDMDKDGVPDVTVRRYVLSNGEVSDDIVDVGADVSQLILRPYTNGEPISATPPSPDVWTTYQWDMSIASGPFMDSSGFTHGPWAGVTNAYLAVRLIRNGGAHYGWINIDFPQVLVGGSSNLYTTECHVLSSGLHAEPNAAIMAGQK